MCSTNWRDQQQRGNRVAPAEPMRDEKFCFSLFLLFRVLFLTTAKEKNNFLFQEDVKESYKQ